MFDVIVVGGGPAGLSAALMLGRCRRHVLLCDTGEPRNRFSRALHGYLTRDGIAPPAFNAIGREELTAYGIQVRHVAVADANRQDDGFRVTFANGASDVSRFLLIATGVTDELPCIGGLKECYGRSVFHCPYCDGWEWRDRRLAVLGAGSGGPALALSLKTWSPRVTLCCNGRRIDRQGRERLARNGVAVRSERIAELAHDDGAVTSVVFQAGAALPCDALFITSRQQAQCGLAVQLGCALNRRGTVKTGKLSDTNVPGVFVAGDASHDAQFVVVAAAEGVKAAVAINQALQRAEIAP